MSILLFLFLLFSVARSCRFWHSVLPRAHFSLCYIYEFHSVCICSSFPGMRRFCVIFFVTSWPMLSVATIIKFILRSTFCSSFLGMRRFWLFLLPHGQCYMLLHLLHSFSIAHFARVLPAWEGFGYFVTSWPMLYVATFITFNLRSTFCSSFPGMRRFWVFCYLMADGICCYIY